MPKNTAVKDTTKNKILKKSLQLFNKRGVHDVSAHDIARDLNISVGNLTYHFKKKNDIVDALSDQLHQEMVLALNVAKTIEGQVEEIAESILQFTKLFWKHRFFFNNVMYITAKDKSQRVRYMAVKSLAVNALVDAYRAFEVKGAANPVKAPNTIELTMENLWYFWLSYLRLYLVETPASKATEKEYTRFSALHMYSFLEPYYTEQVRQGIYNYIIEKS